VNTDVWPEEIRITDGGQSLLVLLEGGERLVIAAELLRVESPSAEVKGHGPGQEVLVWGKRAVRLIRATAVGNYAVRLHFSDGHDTGLYTWAYLAELGRNHAARMASYEERLLAAGLGRD
jgi:DUF971 family protein